MAKPAFIGLGEILWDVFPEGKQLGGAPANFAYHAQCLGAQGVPVSCVGADELGQEIVQLLAEKGVDRRGIAVDDAHPTGRVTVQLDEQGKPDYVIHTDVAWDYLPETPEVMAWAAQARAVCFGTLAQRSPVARATIQAFLAETPPDCLRVFDVNLRQDFYSDALIRASAALANVIKFNDEELGVMARVAGVTPDERETPRALLEQFGLKAVALTRGARGSLLCTPAGSAEHPGIAPQRVADTVGAGDAFTAALALGLTRKLEPEPLNAFANRVASCVCAQTGAMPDMDEALRAELGETDA